jgi:phosphatidylglycerol:prolipoprotein diacylglycerol transferase
MHNPVHIESHHTKDCLLLFSQLPGLALTFPMIDPVLIEVGPLAIRWYGLAYVTGILLGWWYARRLVSTPRLWGEKGASFGKLDLDDFLVWAALGIVLGGRIGYILFYDLGRYIDNPLDIIKIWTGGMSFHGGAIGCMIAAIVFARSRGFVVFSFLDIMAVVSTFGLFFGRIANFINAELWGRPTDVAWAFVFPGGGPEPRHPSQLYEAALEGLALLIILSLLIYVGRKLAAPGFIAGAWVFGYGTARIIVEFFRMPDAHIGYLSGGWLTMGMVLSLPMLAVGIWAMVSAPSRRKAA